MPSSNQEPDFAASSQSRSSGYYSVDLSNTHDDESSAKTPWENLVHCTGGAAELKTPDQPSVVRALPLESLDDAVRAAVGQWFGERTLRHWFAFRGLAIEHGRVSWRLESHLEILGEPESDDVREEAAHEMDRLTTISLTIWTPRRDLRLHAPLLVPLARTERGVGERWLLRDMIVRVHPLLLPEDAAPPTEPFELSEDTLNERNKNTLVR